MITVTFSQELPLELDSLSEMALLMPIIPRCGFYKKWVTAPQVYLPNGHHFFTYDEHLILAVQWAVRKGILPLDEVWLFEVWLSSANGGTRMTTARLLDAEGDFVDDCHGGFFSQRLEFLR